MQQVDVRGHVGSARRPAAQPARTSCSAAVGFVSGGALSKG
jgi:hypothetical protein